MGQLPSRKVRKLLWIYRSDRLIAAPVLPSGKLGSCLGCMTEREQTLPKRSAKLIKEEALMSKEGYIFYGKNFL